MFIPVSILSGSLALSIFYLVLRKHLRRSTTSSDIPIVVAWLPWIGGILQYAWLGPRPFLERYGHQFGSVFGFYVLNRRVVMISSRTALKEYFKRDRTHGFAIMDNQYMHLMVGHNAPKHRRDYIYASISQKAFTSLLRAWSGAQLQVRKSAINDILLHQIRETVKTSSTPMSLRHFVRRTIYQTMVDLFFGRDSLDLYNEGNSLDNAMAAIMYGLGFMVPQGIQARESLYRRLHAHLSENWRPDENGGYLEGAADFVSDFLKELNAAGLTEEEIARYLIGLVWGATSNLMGVAYWTMGHLVTCRETLENIGSESHPATSNLAEIPIPFSEEGSYAFTDSLIQEVLRTKVQLPLVREAQEDTTLPGEKGRVFNIRKGDIVIPDAPNLNLSTEVFENPGTFKADRFVRSTGEALYVFGGGKHMCVGRQLAMHIIRMLVVLTVATFDISLDPSSDTHLEMDYNSFQSWIHAKNDLLIQFSPKASKPLP